jgi:branched-subunit amino acid ABC-type transport system permease component
VQLFLQILVNGVLLGGLYTLMALGLALVWGVLNIVNLAHGAFIMLGGYASYYLFKLFHIDPFATLPIGAIALFGIGYATQRCILNRVISAPIFNTLLITFGLEVVFTYLAQLLFSADFRTINPSLRRLQHNSCWNHFSSGSNRGVCHRIGIDRRDVVLPASQPTRACDSRYRAKLDGRSPVWR